MADNTQQPVVLITGGAGVIATATAKRFLQEGYRIALTDLDTEALQDVKNQLGGPNILTIPGDVTQEADVKNYVDKTLEAFGQIDVFFDNAGIEGAVAPLHEQSEEDFMKVFHVNVKGAWLGLKYVLPHMVERKAGKVIMTSSVAGLTGTPGIGVYTSSKHAVLGLSRTAAKEMAPYGVTVNSLHPGPVFSRMMDSLEEGVSPGKEEEVENQFNQMIPMGRYAKPEEVADLVYFLGSTNNYITGAPFLVDGGMRA